MKLSLSPEVMAAATSPILRPHPKPLLEFDFSGCRPNQFDFNISREHIDPLLIELLATAECLCASASTSKLEEYVNRELG
jgi:hypothetical protein